MNPVVTCDVCKDGFNGIWSKFMSGECPLYYIFKPIVVLCSSETLHTASCLSLRSNPLEYVESIDNDWRAMCSTRPNLAEEIVMCCSIAGPVKTFSVLAPFVYYCRDASILHKLIQQVNDKVEVMDEDDISDRLCGLLAWLNDVGISPSEPWMVDELIYALDGNIPYDVRRMIIETTI